LIFLNIDQPATDVTTAGYFFIGVPMRHNHYRQLIEDEGPAAFERRNKKRRLSKSQKYHEQIYKKHRESGFTCIQCGFPVSVERELSGVNNRNHCPRCLYSRHVDELKAGDRKADCMSRMEPVGLTIKQTHKRYGPPEQGELMLIHICKGCGKISINRIAADDDAAFIYKLFKNSADAPADWKADLLAQGIRPLGLDDLTAVYSRLFGWQPILEEFEAHDMTVKDENTLLDLHNSSQISELENW